jgi:hypothetical protein
VQHEPNVPKGEALAERIMQDLRTEAREDTDRGQQAKRYLAVLEEAAGASSEAADAKVTGLIEEMTRAAGQQQPQAIARALRR